MTQDGRPNRVASEPRSKHCAAVNQRFIPLVLLLASPAVAHAGTIAVFPPTGTNVAPGELAAAGTLLAESIKGATSDTVLSPDETGPALRGQQPAAAAQQLRAGRYVVSNLVRLERNLVLSADLIDSDGGNKRHRQMTLATLDDMQPAAERIANALIKNESISTAQSIDTVTDKDAEQIRRNQVDKMTGVRIGFIAPVAKGFQFDPGFEVLYDMRLEQRYWFFQVAGGAIFGIGGDHSSLKGATLELGAAYYLTGGDFAPFLGGGVSPRLVSIDNLRFGFAPYVTLGATIGRTSTAHFSMELRAFQNVLHLDADHSVNGVTVRSRVYPTELGAFVGIWW